MGFVFCFGANTYGQFAVAGAKKSKSEFCFPKLKQVDYENLKKCITYFVCPEQLLIDRGSLQILLDKSWDYTEIVVIGNNELKDYIGKENAAFFDINILSSSITIQDIYMELATLGEKGVRYARFNLNFNCKMQDIFKKQGSDDLFAYFNSEADILNLKPGIIANYLKLINTKLEDQEFIDCQSKIENVSELKKLGKDTLYITDNAKTKYLSKALKFGCETDLENDAEKLMDRYPFVYKIISFDELSDKIIKGDEFYYTLCIKSQDNVKHISVFKSITGECVYNSVSTGAQFRNDDFGKIARLVER